MSGCTVKRIDEMEAIYGGAYKRARAELGVTSFGMQVIDFRRTSSTTPSTITAATARRRSTSPGR